MFEVSVRGIAIAGITGYSGQELQILLRQHSQFKIKKLIGREDSLQGLNKEVDLAFLCTPHEVSAEMVPRLLEQGISVVDLSGAFRLKKHSYLEWYGFDHPQNELLAKSEYGLLPWTSLQPLEKNQPRLIANPGCFATAAALALIPLLKSGLVDEKQISIDAKSGTTGAGRKAETKLLFSEIFGDFYPYKVGKHQHWPEIVEAVENFTKIQISPQFVTELLPIARGISCAVFARWKKAKSKAALVEFFRETYKSSPEISVSDDLSQCSLRHVTHSNRVQIVVQEAYGEPVIFSILDNLQKGAAGQALQNANVLAGLDVNEGFLL